MFCISIWLLDELHIFSTLPWTRILKCLVSVLTQNGEEGSSRCFGLSPGCAAHTGIIDYFSELHVA